MASAEDLNEGESKTILLYVVPGSQFSAKVVAAMDARQVKHYCHFVPLVPSQRNLPSGGTSVPELTFGSDVILPDSEKILHWLDDNFDTRFFPNDSLASELSMRASDGILANLVLYYNWVDEQGYSRSMKKGFDSILPSFVVFGRGWLVDMNTSSTRSRYRTKISKALDLEEKDLDDKPRIRSILKKELEFFASLLDRDGQVFLLPGKEPTAVDFSVYAQLERLVGDMGDILVHPSIPELAVEETESLAKLWKWHAMMREDFPIKFKGKRKPKA